MKRRAGDAAKLRRPLKRNKLTDNIYSSTLLYLKFLILWAIIILADFILEFRFEFLWPFWMLLRSVYDSFKYQGLAFSMFFVCIALTSDMICFFFIPVQWIFFAASTYVWVQYIWYTEKGVCLPTMLLCSIFIYMEAGVRLRDLRHMPAHLDLCRPFAAHCIGYPVVTLGFGFKSYVGYRMRKRRQQEVARENSFYMQLLQQALPPHEDNSQQQSAIKELDKSGTLSVEKTSESHPSEKQMNGNAVHIHSSKNSSHSKKADIKNNQQNDKMSSSSHPSHALHNHSSHSLQGTTVQSSNFKDVSSDSGISDTNFNSHKTHTSQNHNVSVPNHGSSREKEKDVNSKVYAQQSNQSSSTQSKHAQSNGVANHLCNEKSFSTTSHQCGSPSGASNTDKQNHDHDKGICPVSESEKETNEQKSSNHNSQRTDSSNPEGEVSIEKNVKGSSKTNSKSEKVTPIVNVSSQREERRRNKNKDKDANKEKESVDSGQKHSEQNDNSSRAAGERALRAALAAERQARSEITQLRQQNEQLTAKLNSANASRQADRAALATAERRLTEERRARQAADARHHQLRGMHKSGECVWEWCRQRRAALEQEITSLRDELQQVQEHNQTLTQSLQAAEQQVSTLEARSRDNGADTWLAALTTLRERSLHLERSLSAETRVKLDLFSAVGEAKRQLGLRESVIRTQEKEIDELKGKIAQMLAVMPNDSFSPGPTSGVSKLRLSDSGMPCYPAHISHHVSNTLPSSHSMANNVNANVNNNMSNLDPNATAYTPKGTMVQCGPATEA